MKGAIRITSKISALCRWKQSSMVDWSSSMVYEASHALCVLCKWQQQASNSTYHSLEKNKLCRLHYFCSLDINSNGLFRDSSKPFSEDRICPLLELFRQFFSSSDTSRACATVAQSKQQQANNPCSKKKKKSHAKNSLYG
jgi:diphthamide biosynthesis methyltransferase